MTDTSADVSIRKELTDSGFDNPLRSFDGVYDGADKTKATNYEGYRVDLKFKDLDTVVATSPYIFPTAVINIGESDKKKSRWGFFQESMVLLVPENEDLKDQVGKVFSMVFTDGTDGRPKPKLLYQRNPSAELLEKYPDRMIPTAVWICVGIDGVTATSGSKVEKSVADIAEELLIGKTRADFNKAAYAHLAIRKDTNFQRAITDRSFINTLVQLKKVVEDENGVFQKVT